MFSAPNNQILTSPALLGRLLRDTRKQRKMTQGFVAQQVGVSQNRLSTLERNPEDISMAQLHKWCAALRLELRLSEQGST